eukprot:5617662-Pyramimonas_sp.AAC.2
MSQASCAHGCPRPFALTFDCEDVSSEALASAAYGMRQGLGCSSARTQVDTVCPLEWHIGKTCIKCMPPGSEREKGRASKQASERASERARER